MNRIRIGPDLYLVLRPPRASGRSFYVAVSQARRLVTRIESARLRPLPPQGDPALRDGFHILRKRTELPSDGPSITKIDYLLTYKSGDLWWQHSPTQLKTSGVLLDPYNGKAQYQVLTLPRAAERYLMNFPNIRAEE